MKRLFYRPAVKAVALLLSLAMAVVVVVGAVTMYLMLDRSFYTRSLDTVRREVLSDVAAHEIWRFQGLYDPETRKMTGDFYDRYAESNLCYSITAAEDGAVIADNTDGVEIFCSASERVPVYYYNAATEEHEVHLIVGLFVRKEYICADKYSTVDRIVRIGYSMRFGIPMICFAAFVCFVLLWVGLISTAGRTVTSEAAHTGVPEKIPFDLWLVAVLLIAVCGLAVLQSCDTRELLAISAMIILPVLYFAAAWTVLTFAIRVKTGTLLRKTVLYRMIALLFRGCKALFGRLWWIIRNLGFVWKSVLITAAVVLTETVFIGIAVGDGDDMIVLPLLFLFAVAVGVLYVSVMLSRLKRDGEKIASGQLECKVDTSMMTGDFRRFGESLNSIGTGLQTAVNERMKSERMKTELITNVSHDIKTPLTSIVNYVDLIGKENIENEKVREYVSVLERQSGRLKKLIEDLVEASKASSGTLSVNAVPCDIGVLLSQAAGEYDERLSASKLTPVITIPGGNISVLADGRHMWRVFDNLLNNICKYAQPSTRVYLNLAVRDNTVEIVFRNISKAELNISSDELMERFVRGDSSRNTDGSGLGLSITKSLTELQGGTLEIGIDGDLFKVTLCFPKFEGDCRE